LRFIAKSEWWVAIHFAWMFATHDSRFGFTFVFVKPVL